LLLKSLDPIDLLLLPSKRIQMEPTMSPTILMTLEDTQLMLLSREYLLPTNPFPSENPELMPQERVSTRLNNTFLLLSILMLET